MIDKTERPDPDELLKHLKEEEENKSTRGSLKIFFGACAGVGKTYAMLLGAREKMADGVNVLVGVVETHGRPETEELLEKLTILPPMEITYEGIRLKEFNLNKALKLKPMLILIDELAHTNAPGSRHPKRWMDIQELLDAGIDVYTTLNVQHLESYNDIVAGITGIQVKETVPDSILDQADDIVLVDLPSDELLIRLREGKIYISDLGKQKAAENFFRLENLTALREMALRRTAERVDAQRLLFVPHKQKSTSKVLDRIVICVGGDENTLRNIRVARLLATSLNAPWIGVYVENQRHYKQDKAYHLTVDRHLRLVEQLGGKTQILHGENAAQSIIDFAQQQGVTKIIVGKSPKSRWREFREGALATDLIGLSGVIDIYVVNENILTGKNTVPHKAKTTVDQGEVILGVGIPLCITVIGLISNSILEFLDSDLNDYQLFSSRNIMLLFLLGIVYSAVRYGKKSALLTTIVSLVMMLLFYPPGIINPIDQFMEIMITKPFLITIGIFSLVSYLIGRITSSLQSQSQYFETKSLNMENLFAMSRKLASSTTQTRTLEIIKQYLESSFDGTICLWLAFQQTAARVGKSGEKSTPKLTNVIPSPTKLDAKENSAIQWAFEKKQRAGKWTNTLPSARGHYIPLEGPKGIIGVLGLFPNPALQELTSEEFHMLETFVSLAIPALERLLRVETMPKKI